MFTRLNGRQSQIVYALSASLGAFVVGTVLGRSSPGNDTAAGAEAPSSMATVSWLFAVGALAAGAACSVFGRRVSLIVSEAHVALGWLLPMVVARARRTVYVARILQGVGSGAMCTIIPVYVGEIAEPEIRGFLGGLHQLFVVSGVLYTSVLGNHLSHAQLDVACGVWMAVHALLVACYIPESPYFLTREDEIARAEESLARLRDADHDRKSEMDEIQKFAEVEQKDGRTARELLEKDENRRALIIGVGCMFFQQTTGIDAIVFHLRRGGSAVGPVACTTAIGAIQVIMTAVSTTVTDKFGRRSLMVYSLTTMGVCLLALSYYFFAKTYKARVVDSLGWLPLVAVAVYVSVYAVGCGPVPYVIVGEIFSSELKSMGAGLSVATNWISVWIVTSLAGPMDTFMGPSGTFFLYSGFCFLGMLFVVNRVPETKNRSLADIQSKLEKN